MKRVEDVVLMDIIGLVHPPVIFYEDLYMDLNWPQSRDIRNMIYYEISQSKNRA